VTRLPALVMVLAVTAACGRGKTTPAAALVPAGPRLPEPLPVAPTARGAAYLAAAADVIQPQWAQFLEDCRLRLPKGHPLNVATLAATAELAIARDGRIADIKIVDQSGNGDFDTAVFDVLGDVSPLPHPPGELASDDGLVHVRWLFARDRRQAGPATAQVISVELPLLGVVDKLLALPTSDALAYAIRRVVAAPATDPERTAAAEHVLVAVLREALAGGTVAVRHAAIDAIGRAKVRALADEVALLIAPVAEDELRLAAIDAVRALGDATVLPQLAADLADDLAHRPKIALAKLGALVALGRAELATAAVRAAAPDGKEPSPTVLAALGVAPDAQLAGQLAGWFGRGNARAKIAICGALPAAAPDQLALVGRGLRDPDATVRATCAEAAMRFGKDAADASVLKRLHELARDRDQLVRARAIAAINTVDAPHRERALDDTAREVRIAACIGAPESELRTLAADKDADVRAAAIAELGDRAPDVTTRAAADPAPQVRRAAATVVADTDALAQLATDDSPDVAAAALVRIAAHRGRAALVTPLLNRLVQTPPASHERVRIALAWLLAR
jgi:TonB-like protein